MKVAPTLCLFLLALGFGAAACSQAPQASPSGDGIELAVESKAPALQVSQNVPAPHIQLAIGQSDRVAPPGSRLTLSADVKLPKGVHVYAPGAEGYRVTELRVPQAPEYTLASSSYPQSKELYLEAVKETVPVFEGDFRISQDVAISLTPAFSGSLGEKAKTIEINGEFRYQACDDRICYLPEAIPVKWQVQVLPLDGQRAPEAVQHP